MKINHFVQFVKIKLKKKKDCAENNFFVFDIFDTRLISNKLPGARPILKSTNKHKKKLTVCIPLMLIKNVRCYDENIVKISRSILSRHVAQATFAYFMLCRLKFNFIHFCFSLKKICIKIIN